MNGDSGQNQVSGTSSSDNLTGTSGIDAIHAMAGDDVLNGGASADFYDGGAGNDRYILADDAVDTLLFRTDDEQQDILDISQLLPESADSDNLSSFLKVNDKGVFLDSGGQGQFSTENQIARFAANNPPFNALIAVQIADTSVIQFDWTKTADIPLMDAPQGTTEPGADNNQVNGSVNADTLMGTASADTLNAQAGDDVLRGGAGADVYKGGAGNDRYVLEGTDAVDTLYFRTDSVQQDVLDISALLPSSGVTAGTLKNFLKVTADEIYLDVEGEGEFTENDKIAEFAENNPRIEDVIKVQVAENVVLDFDWTETASISLSAPSQPDFLSSEVLAQHLVNDSGDGNADRGFLRSTEGQRFQLKLDEHNLREAIGGAGDEELDASNVATDPNGRINLFGRAGADTLMGNDDNTYLDGGEGNDRFEAGRGRNFLAGGSGEDEFALTFEASSGDDIKSDILYDFKSGSGERDVLDLSDVLPAEVNSGNLHSYLKVTGKGVYIDLTGNGHFNEDSQLARFGEKTDIDNLVSLKLSDGSEILLNRNEALDSVDGGSSADKLKAGEGSDTLRGNAGDDELDGDALATTKSADHLFGGEGNDKITADKLDFTDGTVDGGVGFDRVFVNEDAGENVNVDLHASNIEYAAGGASNDVLDGSGFTDTSGGYNKETGAYDTSEAQRLDLYGHDGRDTLIGGVGRDYLDGGAHADILSGGQGRDLYTGGSGSDTFVLADDDELDLIYDYKSTGDQYDVIDISALTPDNFDFSSLPDYFHIDSDYVYFDPTGSGTFTENEAVARLGGGTVIDNEYMKVVVDGTHIGYNPDTKEVVYINTYDPNATGTGSDIAEDSAANTVVGQAGFTDQDGVESVTYSITGGNNQGYFAIDSDTGQVTLTAEGAAGIDYKTATSHTLQIVATDRDFSSSPVDLVINLTDVNDEAPNVSVSTSPVAENSAEGTVVGQVTGVDPDTTGESISYAISSGNSNGYFAIDAATGEVSLTSAGAAVFDYETMPSHTLYVTATDGTNTSSPLPFTIQLSDVNEAPEVSGVISASATEDLSFTLTQANLLENTSDVDGDSLTVSNVAVNSGQVSVTDNGDGTWTVTPQSNWSGDSQLSFDISDGSLSVSNQIDITVAGVADNPTLTVGGNTEISHTNFNSGLDTGWTSEHSVESHATGGPVGTSASGTRVAELDAGGTGNPDAYYYSIDTGKGHDHEVSLMVKQQGNYDGTDEIEVVWNGEVLQTIDPGTSWQEVKVTLPDVGENNTQLIIREAAGQNNGVGPLLDQITVNRLGAVDSESADYDKIISNQEDTVFTLNLGATLADNDGSESLAVTLGGIPSGFSVTDGSNTISSDGSDVDVTGWNLAELTFTPVSNYDTDFDLTVTATSTEGDDTASSTRIIRVDMQAVDDAATITGTDTATVYEDASSTLVKSGSLLVDDVDTGESAFVAETVSGSYGSVTINSSGYWVYSADNSQADIQGLGKSQALYLNSNSDDYVRIESDLVPSDDFTISMWVKPDAIDSGLQGFFGSEPGGASSRSPSMYVSQDGKLQWSSNGTDNVAYVGETGTVFEAGEWSHITWVKDGSNYHFYKDGALIHSDSAPADVKLTGFTNLGRIDNSFDGQMDDVQTYDRALSASEISDAMAGETQSGLFAHYDFAGYSLSQALEDRAGNHPDGVANGNMSSADLVDRVDTITDTITVQTLDGTTHDINITISGNNDIPKVDVDSASVHLATEDNSLVLTRADLLSNISDVDDANNLSISDIRVEVGKVSITDNHNGTWTLTPDADWSGTGKFSFIVSDGRALIRTKADFSVSAEADTPVVTFAAGENPEFNINEDETAAISLSAQFGDFDGSETHSLILSNIPTGVTISDGVNTEVVTSGSLDIASWSLADLTVTPPANSHDNFELTLTATATEASGSESSVVKTIPVNITAVDDAPVSSDVDLGAIDEDGSRVITKAELLANASDVDGDTLSIASITLDSSAHGALVDNGNDTWTFTPTADFHGEDIGFTLVVSDGTSGDEATVAVTLDVTSVADAPELQNALSAQAVDEEVAFNWQLPSDTFIDRDGDTLSYSATLADGADLPEWLTFDASTRTFSGTPDDPDLGTIQVRVTASDGALSTSEDVSITVNSVNDLPVLTITPREADAPVQLNTTTAGDQQGLDMAVRADGGFVAVWTDKSERAEGRIMGRLFDADGQPETAEFRIDNESTQSDSPKVAFHDDGSFIVAWNDSTPGVKSWVETQSFDASGNPQSSNRTALSGNIHEPEIITLDGGDYVVATFDSWHGMRTEIQVYDSNGNAKSGVITTGSLSGWSDRDYELTDLSDGNWAHAFRKTSTGDIEVNIYDATGNSVGNASVNASEAGFDLVSLDEGGIAVVYRDEGSTKLQLLNNDGSRNGLEINLDAVSGTGLVVEALTDGSLFVGWEESGGLYGQRFLADGTSASGKTQLTDDADASGLSVSELDDGSLQLGWHTSGIDGDGSAVVKSNLMLPVDDLANGTVVARVSATDDDPGDTLTFSLTNDAGGRYAIDSSTGDITIADQSLIDYAVSPSHTLTVAVSDGTVTETLDYTIYNNNNNQAPETADSSISAREDITYSFSENDFPIVDPNSDDYISEIRVESLPDEGNLTLNGSAVFIGDTVSVADIQAGNLQYLAGPNDNGSDYTSFTFNVADRLGLYSSTPKTLTIDVSPENDAPIVTSADLGNTSEDTDIVITEAQLLVNASDIDGDTLSVTSVSVADSDHGTVSDNGDGSWTFSPADDFNGNDVALNFEVSDGNSGTANGTATIDVTAVADALDINVNTNNAVINSQDFESAISDSSDPAYNYEITSLEDTAIPLDLGSITSAGSESIAVNLADIPSGSVLTDGNNTVNADGGAIEVTGWNLNSLTLTPPVNSNADFTITINATATEANADSASASKTLRVNLLAANDTPDAISLDSLSVSENAPGATVGTLTTTDIDTGDSHSYAVSDNRFEVMGGELKLKAGVFLDMETEGSVNISITSTDSAGAQVSESFTLTVTDANDAPINTGAVSKTGDEDHSFVLTEAELLANTSDVDNDTLSVTNVRVDSGSVNVTDNGNGTWTVNPASNWSGTGQLSFDVSDGIETVTGQADLTVTGEADAPVLMVNGSAVNSVDPAYDKSVSGLEDTDIALDFSASLTDSDGSETLMVSLSGIPSGFGLSDGSNSITSDGSAADISGWNLSNLTLTPVTNYETDFTLTLSATATESSGGDTETVTQTIRVDMQADQDAPDVNNVDLGSTDEDAGIVITQAQLLANSSDVDGDDLSVTDLSVTNASHGSVTDNGNGTWTYTPASNFNGSDVAFSFTVSDGFPGNDQVGAATIDVSAVNDAPDAGSVLTKNANEDQSFVLTEAELLANASDVDGDTLSVTNVRIGSGSASVSGNGDGTWTVTPSPDWSGNSELLFDISDGQLVTTGQMDMTFTAVADSVQLSASVRLQSDPVPVITEAQNFSSASEGIQIDLGSSDAQTVLTGEENQIYNVTSVKGSNHDDVFNFSDPQDGIVYTIDGGGGSNTLDLSRFTASNVSLSETSAVVDLGSGESFTVNFSNIDRVRFDSSVTNGDPHQVEFGTGDWTGQGASLSVRGLNSDEKGIALVDYEGSLSENFTLSASVTAHDSSEKYENGFIVFDYQDANNFKMVRAHIQADYWTIRQVVDGVESSVASVNAVLDAGVPVSVTMRANGGLVELLDGNTVLTSYDFGAPVNTGSVGVGSEFSDTDFVLNLQPSNWAPDVEDYDLVLDVEDIPIITTNVLADATDADGDALSIASFTQASNGSVVDNGDGTFTYTPQNGFTGIDSFNYTISDGVNTSEGSVRIDVTDNHSVGVNAGSTTALDIDIAAVLSDTDGSESLSITLSGIAEGVSFSDGVNTYTAAAGDSTLDISSWQLESLVMTTPATNVGAFDLVISATATDGADSKITTSVIKILDLDDAPEAGNVDLGSSNEDTAVVITSAQLLANSTDADGNTLSVVSVSLSNDAQGSLVDNGDDTWTFMPATDFNGNDVAFNFTVTDGTGTTDASATATIDVLAVNDRPTGADNLLTLNEDSTYTLSADDFGFVDVDTGDSLQSVQIQSLPTNGSLQLNGVDVAANQVISVADIDNDNLTFTPAENDSGAGYTSLTFSVNDGTADSSAQQTLTFDVVGVADAASIALDANVYNDLQLDTELITNGDFTASQSGWDFTGNVERKSDGSVSFSSGNRPVNGVIEQVVATLPDVNYTASVDYSSYNNYTTSGRLELIDEDTGAVLATGDMIADTGDTWQTLSLNFVGAGTGNTILRITDTSASTTARDFKIDNVSLLAASVDNEHIQTTLVEDHPIAVDLSVSFPDNDGSETHQLDVAGVPANAVISDGTNSVTSTGAVINITGWNLAELTVTPELNHETDFTLTVTATTTENSNGDSIVTSETVLVDIQPVQDAAVISGDDTGSVTEDAAATLTTTGTLSASDVDAGDTGFTAETVAGSYGSVTIDADGNWTYSADNTQSAIQSLASGETLNDTLNVRSIDGTTHAIEITLTGTNDAPVASGVDLGSVNEDSSVVITQAQLLANASDIDGDSLSIASVSLDNGAQGVLTDNGNNSWTFAPAADFNGDNVAFSFTVSDGGSTASATATIDVSAVNDAATAVTDSDSGNASVAGATVTGSASVLANDSDIEGDSLTVAQVNGTAVSGSTTISGDYGDLVISEDGTWTYNPDTPDLQADLVGFWKFDGNTLDSAEGDATTDTGTLMGGATTNGSGLNGSSLSLTSSGGSYVLDNSSELNQSAFSERTVNFSFRIDESNDLSGKQVLFEEGGTTRGFNAYIDSGKLYVGGWDNSIGWDGTWVRVDVPVDNDFHNLSLVLGNNQLSAHLDGNTMTDTVVDISTGTKAMSLAHQNVNFGGVHSDTFFHDGVYDMPDLGIRNTFIGDIDEARIYNRALNEQELNALNYEYKIGSLQDVFTYTVSDGTDTSTSTLTIDVNRAPEALSGTLSGSDGGVIAGQLSATDYDDGDTLTYALETVPTKGSVTINADGSYTFNPGADFESLSTVQTENVTFDFRVTDSQGDSSVNTVTVTVTGTNIAPVLADVSLGIDENSSNSTSVGTVAGSDANNDSLTYTLTDDAGGRFAIDSITGEVTVANGSLLNFESSASHTISVQVSDGYLTDTRDYTINLTDVNEAPESADATLTATEDSALVLSAVDFLFSDVDAGDTLNTVVIKTLPAAGSLTLNGVAVSADQSVSKADIDAGLLTFTPAANASGDNYANFTFTVSDGETESATANIVTINVTPDADAPTLTVGDVATDGLVGFWNFDETSGSTATDSTGTTGNGTLNNTTDANWVSGVENNALSFDGTNDYVSTSDLSPVLGGTSTLSFWINTTDSNGSAGIIGVTKPGDADIAWGQLDSSGHISLNVGEQQAATSTTSVNDGNWHHVVITRDETSGETQMYVDGELENSTIADTGLKAESFSDIGRVVEYTDEVTWTHSGNTISLDNGYQVVVNGNGGGIDIVDSIGDRVTVRDNHFYGPKIDLNNDNSFDKEIASRYYGQMQESFVLDDGTKITMDIDGGDNGRILSLTITKGMQGMVIDNVNTSSFTINDANLDGVTLDSALNDGNVLYQNGAFSEANWYINSPSYTISTTGTYGFSAQNTQEIGSQVPVPNTEDRFFDGVLDSVRVYNKVLDANEVSEIFGYEQNNYDTWLAGAEDTAISFDIASALTDTDGSETLTVSVAGVPSGATLSDGINSVVSTGADVDISGWDFNNLSVTPETNNHNDFTLTVTSTATETANSDQQSVSKTIHVEVASVADAPVSADGNLWLKQADSYTFSAGDFSFTDGDSGDTLQSITITSLPTSGSLTLNDVAVTASQVISVGDIANLKYTAPATDPDVAGSFGFTVSDGSLSSDPQTFNLNVRGTISDNLLTNASAENGTSGWNVIENGGSGWGASGASHDGDGKSWATSYQWNKKSQTVDLLAKGFTEEALDAAPDISISDWYKDSVNNDSYYLKVELRDADNNVIDSFNTGTLTATDNWNEAANVFSDYGAGVRYVYFEHGGKDSEYWGGQYGAQIDDSEVIIKVGDVELVGTDADEIIDGTDQADILRGEGGADTLLGDAGADLIFGGDGDDQIAGGAGNDILSGGNNSDTFIWHASDVGLSGSPAEDTITDFHAGQGGDVIDLSDVLVDDSEPLENYLSLNFENGDTTIEVKPAGGSDVTQKIKLEGVDLSSYGGGANDSEILNNLIDDGNLQID